jgi:hypothetical protein
MYSSSCRDCALLFSSTAGCLMQATKHKSSMTSAPQTNCTQTL